MENLASLATQILTAIQTMGGICFAVGLGVTGLRLIFGSRMQKVKEYLFAAIGGMVCVVGASQIKDYVEGLIRQSF